MQPIADWQSCRRSGSLGHADATRCPRPKALGDCRCLALLPQDYRASLPGEIGRSKVQLPPLVRAYIPKIRKV